MKKFIIAVMSAFYVVGAYAAGENERATSVGYIAEELETRQDKFNKLGADTAMTYSGTTDGAVGSRTITGDLGAETNTSATTLPTVGAVNTKVANKQDELDFAANTVLMDTGVAGAPAAKGIYDDSGSYADQQSSLIEAATFNAALQNAINSEFTCAQRKDPNDPNSKCLLFNIFTPVSPSRNLFDVSKVPNRFFNGVGIVNNGDGSITVTAQSGNSAVFTNRKLSALAPGLMVGHTYTFSMITGAKTKAITLIGKDLAGAWSWYVGTSHIITQDDLDSNVYFQAPTTQVPIRISNIQIEEGTVATPYQPYGQNTFLPQNQ